MSEMHQTASIMKPVNSATISKIGHVPDTNTLIVEFPSGTYVYDNVPAELHQKLMDSESKGKFFAANIRGKFTTTKIPNPAPNENKNHELVTA